MRSINRLSVLLASLALGACSATAQPSAAVQPSAQPAARPTLVVMLTIDQLGSDYLERFGGNLTGGLRRLRDEGATWMRGRHDHAIAETAPGHATVLSGRYPARTGIASNSQGVNTNEHPLLGSGDIGASPFRFRGTVLLDWMRAADSSTRALSVSRKDRGAILPMGRARTEVYWWASNGIFTTSTYYRTALPGWVSAFNERRLPQRFAGRTWTPLLPPNRYAEPDSVFVESAGRDYAFPHQVPDDPELAVRALPGFPFVDSLTLAFALEGVRALGLGADARRTDLLAISLSATDAVGHRFGPDSKEIHDQVLQLDRYLGLFLTELLALRGADRVVVALTADHGVAPLPELRSPYYANHDAQRVDTRPAWRLAFEAMRARGVDSAAVMDDDGFRIRDREAFRRAGVEPDSIAAVWVRALRRLNGVQRAELLADLAKADTARDPIARRWLHMLPLDGDVRAVVTLEPFGYWQGVTYATHGQAHDYDTQVPILFWGRGIAPGRRAGEARVVDIAPTLATLLGVRPLETLDGRVLTLSP
jgi:predicted AlkP superfamily pyrophosphatase or phosphodiesterase